MRGSLSGSKYGSWCKEIVARHHKSAASLLMAQTRLFRNLKGSVAELHDLSARRAFIDLQQLTSGSISTAQLERMGHPYGRGVRGGSGKAMRGVRGRARIKPSPINKQTGRLNRSIYLKATGRHRYRLGASAPYAKYQFSPWGTKRMVRRGVMGGRKHGAPIGEIEKRWRARLKGIREGIKKAGRS